MLEDFTVDLMRHVPYAHQRREFLEHWSDEARGLLWQMRTGKSKSTIDRACRLFLEGEIDAVLVVAPNGVHANWVMRELPAHHWSMPWSAHVWRTSRSDDPAHQASMARVLDPTKRRIKWLAVNSEALIYEKTQDAIKAFLKVHGRVLLVVDESHQFGAPGSKRTKLVRKLATRCSRRMILTGTPVMSSPLAAFTQFEILKPQALGFKTFADFKRRYADEQMQYGARSYPVIVGYKNLEELSERMAEYVSVVLREDCDDMPDLVRLRRHFELADEQRDAYRQLSKRMADFLDDRGTLTSLEGGALALKMQQVLSGFVIDDAGKVVDLVPDDRNPRLEAMLDELSDNKTIVWCLFKEDIKRVCRALERNSLGYVELHGGVKSHDRDENIDRFQRDPSVRVIVGQPAAGGSGIDLSAADKVIWYSHTPSAIDRCQASERATRVGGRCIEVVDVVAPKTRDEHILWITDSREAVSDEVAGKRLRDLIESWSREGCET